MSKTKTATIRVNHIFGTKNSFCADVMYRGKVLRSFDGHVPQDLCNSSRTWAHNQGFTLCKVIFG